LIKFVLFSLLARAYAPIPFLTRNLSDYDILKPRILIFIFLNNKLFYYYKLAIALKMLWTNVVCVLWKRNGRGSTDIL